MSDARKFDDILNECIERVLDGESVESCLAAFPEYAAELEPLLRTAVATWNATDVLPRPEFRQRAANEFQWAVRSLKPRRSNSLRWQVRLVTAFSIVVVTLLAGTGTVAAASNSLPDQPLYGVKLFTENVRVALTPSAVGKAELYAEFTDTRVSEIIKMADEGKVAEVEKTTERMNSHLTAITRLTGSTTETGTAGEATPVFNADSEVTAAPTNAAAPALTPAAAPVPTSVAPPASILVTTPPPTPAIMSPPDATATQPAPRLASNPTPTQTPAFGTAIVPGITSQAPSLAQKATPAPAPTPEKAASVNATKLAGSEKATTAIKKDEKADLQTTMSRQATKNAEDLKEALKRVPDSVKPSVEKAIDVAGRGYDEALKNIDRKK